MIGFPFDSVVSFDEHGYPIFDRAVSSKPLKALIGKLFTTGVMPNPSNNLQVFANEEGMTVTVKAGFCVIEGGLKLEDTDRTLEIQASDSVYDRIDTVVMRWNGNDNARICDLYVIKGTPAPTPIRPELNRTGSIYEIGLADIFIPQNTAVISQQRITDTRMESARCGIVSSVSEWDTTTIYTQIQADLTEFKDVEEADFLEWYESIKDRIDDITAELLQRQIDDLESNKVDKVEGKGLSTNDYDNTAKGIVDGMSTALAGKVDKVAGKGLSTNDYTNTDKNKVASIKPDATTINGNPLSFTTDSAQVSSNTVIMFEPIQSGSGDASPNNEKPISGYNSADVTVPQGKNLVYKEILSAGVNDSGKITNSSGFDLYIAPIVSGKTYTASKPSGSAVYYGFFASEPRVDGVSYNSTRYEASAELISISITAPITGFIGYMVAKALSYTTVQIEEGPTATTYEPYNPITDISEPFPFTVYGGTLDVESGELTVDRIKLTGLDSWIWGISSSVFTSNNNALNQVKTTINPICNTYKGTSAASTSADAYAKGNLSVCFSTRQGRIFIRDDSYTSETDFRNSLASCEIVCGLATPITYHLTPHQVRLLEGANVVTSNGTSLSLTYRNGEVAILEDLDGLAESVNGLSIKVNDALSPKIKSVEYAGSDASFLVAFVKTLTPEQVATARVRLNNGIWLYPMSATDTAVFFESIPQIAFINGEPHLSYCYEINQSGQWYKDINISNPSASTQASVILKMILYYIE